MTDENLGVDNSVSAGSTGDMSPATQSQPSEQLANQAPSEQERTFTQSEVNNIVSSRVTGVHKGYETRAAQTQSQPVAQQQTGGFDKAELKELVKSQVSEIATNQQAAIQEQQVKDEQASIYRNIDANIEANVPEAEQAEYLASLKRVNGFAGQPAILHIASSLDNSAEVLGYLSSDEGLGKLAEMSVLSYEATTDRIKKISDRLKQNKSAKTSPSTPNPISQIETNVKDGMSGGEPNSVADYMSIYPG